jgi:hypothetical protein
MPEVSGGAPAFTRDKERRRRISPRLYLIGAPVAAILLIAIIFAIRYQSGGERRRYERVLTAALDRLVTAQEGFYYDSTRYTASLRALPTVQLPPGVRVQIFNPDRRSWWGVATHDRLPGKRCVVWVGSAPASLPADARAPEDETRPMCFDERRVVARQPSRS